MNIKKSIEDARFYLFNEHNIEQIMSYFVKLNNGSISYREGFDIVGINKNKEIKLEKTKYKNYQEYKTYKKTLTTRKIKNILVLEDEPAVINKFITAIQLVNQKQKEYYINLNVITSVYDSIDINLGYFDSIFIDRDNSLGEKDNFHDFIIPRIEKYSKKQKTLKSFEKLANKIYPISGGGINNGYLKEKLVDIFMKQIFGTGIITDFSLILKIQKGLESIIEKNIYTKSITDLSLHLENVLTPQ